MPTVKHLEGRQALLHEYLREVVKELVQRGILAAQTEKDPVKVLRKHTSEMLGVMARDLKEAGFSIGNEIVGGIVSGLIGSVIGKRG